MMQVAGQGRSIMVHRPWTQKDMMDATAHLPDPTVSGTRLSDELLIFCKEFSPTTHELRRLLMKKLGPVAYVKVHSACQGEGLASTDEDEIMARGAAVDRAEDVLGWEEISATYVTRKVTGLPIVPRETMTAVPGMSTPIRSLTEPRGRRGHVERAGAIHPPAAADKGSKKTISDIARNRAHSGG
ncbi:hypothetical protein L3Q82_014409 [Scortum barcoo]|uniref:Uncharacterized protein n=1 Tax=Scortum barcoo TaxID=214431 RepID=A0ACB8VWK0_9TELE|nr:hypothetical protein L3Q82_014409 [Scortum barcoo]